MVVPRLSLLGLIKANRPELAPQFFQTDLSPSIFGILKFISRSECEWWRIYKRVLSILNSVIPAPGNWFYVTCYNAFTWHAGQQM